MKWLVLVHVLSAILGLGPAFAFPWMMRSVDRLEEMKRIVLQVSHVEIFPKIFGTLAILSGLLLYFVGSYGSFTQVWLLGSLLVFLVIEVLVIGFMAPSTQRLLKLLDAKDENDAPSTVEATRLYAHVRGLHMASCVLSLVLLAFMIVKP